ncbi:MAG: hypothetical protein GY744_19515 [Gammaproteobacteria bacterium]|nr:hypothetical protein [Gammaproteobacteria bacterium]
MLEINEFNKDNFQISDGAQRIEDFDEITSFEGDTDDDMVSLFRSYEGS